MTKRHAFLCGYCTQREFLALRSGKWKKVEFPAISFLLKTEEAGYLLFDLGYSKLTPQLYSKFPFSLQQMLLPVTIPESQLLERQLSNLKIKTEQIKSIIISHFHSDHLGDASLYKNASILCSKEGLKFSQKLQGIKALKNAVHPSLITEDFKQKAKFFEDQKIIDTELPFFPKGYKLDSQGNLVAISLPGHSLGQYGLYLKSEKIFLVADAAWSIEAIRKNCLPHFLTSFINSSWKDFRQTLDKLHHLSIKCPDLKLLPTHDPQSKNLFDA